MYILNCTQSISHHLLEGRRLKAAVVTLVALGALSILLGTLAILSMQGAVQTSLAAVGPEGMISLVSGGFLIMLLAQRLYAARKGYVGHEVSFTHSEVSGICEIISEQKSSVSTELISGHFFVKCTGSQSEREILEAAHTLLRDERCEDHFIAPIEIAKLSDDVEVAVFVEDPSKGTLIQQRDRYLHFQQGDDPSPCFENLLRLICKEQLYVPENLANSFPLSREGKVIFLRLHRIKDLNSENFLEGLQHFFDAMPTRWHKKLRDILKQEELQLVEPLATTVSDKREEEHSEFQAFLDKKKITCMSDPVTYAGDQEDLREAVARLNGVLKERNKQKSTPLTLIYQRTLSCKIREGQDSKELAGRFKRLFDAGVIYSFERTEDRFTVRL